MVNGQVEDNMANSIIAQLKWYSFLKIQGKQLKCILIPGGSISAGIDIYDTMQLIKSPVHATVLGLAASMGSIYY